MWYFLAQKLQIKISYEKLGFVILDPILQNLHDFSLI